jgi:hypothetical protein
VRRDETNTPDISQHIASAGWFLNGTSNTRAEFVVAVAGIGSGLLAKRPVAGPLVIWLLAVLRLHHTPHTPEPYATPLRSRKDTPGISCGSRRSFVTTKAAEAGGTSYGIQAIDRGSHLDQSLTAASSARATATSIASAPRAPTMERPIGNPSTVAPGILTCGTPVRPPCEQRQEMRSRSGPSTCKGSPFFGAGNGVVGRQRIVSGGSR